MCTIDSYVSSYRGRPLQGYDEVIRDTGVRTARASGGDGGVEANRVDDDNATSGFPKRGRRREGEAGR